MNSIENLENAVVAKSAAEIKNEGEKKFGVNFDDPKAVLHFSFTLTSQPELLFELSNMFRDYEAATNKEKGPDGAKNGTIEQPKSIAA